jgi:gamma-D-glutamyl-L-lysine dipeptidyl-peptidase
LNNYFLTSKKVSKIKRLFLLFGLLSLPLYGEHYISIPVASMHSEPTELEEVISQVRYGTSIAIQETQGEWIRIKTSDNYLGWVPAEAVIELDHPYPSSHDVAQVEVRYSHIYRVSDTTPHPPIFSLPYGSQLELFSPEERAGERWHQVRLIDGEPAWIHRGDFERNPSRLSLEEMVAKGREFMGIPYTWGGTTAFGFDCSGFVQTLYRLHGVELPRDSPQQANTPGAIKVARSELEVGDLLFFGRKPSRITHVGLYIGDGKYLHSETVVKEGLAAVRIDDLDEPEPLQPLICARRVHHLSNTSNSSN